MDGERQGVDKEKKGVDGERQGVNEEKQRVDVEKRGWKQWVAGKVPMEWEEDEEEQ